MADPARNASGGLPGIAARISQAARYVISGVSENTWMSPLQPLAPMAPKDVKGRLFDFPVGMNLDYRPRARERINFQRLRLLAENCGILRTVIERQKDLIEAFEWQIKPREDTPGHRPPESKYATEVKAFTAFFRKPDMVNDWAQWLNMLLEELFVIDAVSVYRRPTADGQRLWGLELIAGDTITPLVDASGRRPQPPSPAYQQILKGIPASDFSLQELIYYPKSPRANRLYGMPPVQWIIDYVETSILRAKSQLGYFTEGNMVDGFFTGPQEWQIEQIKDWQTYWDDSFSGNIEARRRGQWVPFGSKFEPFRPAPLKDEFDEWLARVICYAYSTSPLPFVKAMNRGNQDSQQEVAEEGGIATYMNYIKRLADKVIVEDLQNDDLEFCWSEDREFDPAIAAEIDDKRVRNGTKTVNEVRDRNGDDPYPAWADQPIIITPTGPVPLEETLDRAKQDAINPPAPPPVMAPHGAPGQGGASPPAALGSPGGGAATKPATKPANANLAKRAAMAVPLESRTMVRAHKTVRDLVAKRLGAAGALVKEEVRRQLLILGKADPKDPQKEAADIAAGVNLSTMDSLADDLQDVLADVAEDSANGALVQLGVADYADLTDQVAQRALVWARGRAAELVGKRWTADGELIDNPNPQWAITESTRNMLRTTIADGLEKNLSVPQIADSIAESYPFSRDRADLIAHTEIRRANMQGSLEGAREARDGADIKVQKVWLLGQEPCDVCQDNEGDGAIDLDDDFSSGDDAPPAHPNCYCTISWEVGE